MVDLSIAMLVHQRVVPASVILSLTEPWLPFRLRLRQLWQPRVSQALLEAKARPWWDGSPSGSMENVMEDSVWNMECVRYIYIYILYHIIIHIIYIYIFILYIYILYSIYIYIIFYIYIYICNWCECILNANKCYGFRKRVSLTSSTNVEYDSAADHPQHVVLFLPQGTTL